VCVCVGFFFKYSLLYITSTSYKSVMFFVVMFRGHEDIPTLLGS